MSVNLRPIVIPGALILIANLLGGMGLLPVAVQVLANGCSCVYIGCVMSIRFEKVKSRGKDGDAEKEEELVLKGSETTEEVITMNEALKFPLMASLFLVGAYLIVNYVSKELINLILTLYVCLATVVSLSTMLLAYF